jgi:hypothetical protein
MVPVNVTIAGFNGLKSVVLQYNKKCGGHKKGLKVWVPSSHLYNGNDRTKYVVMDAGRRTPLVQSNGGGGDSVKQQENEESAKFYSDDFATNEKIEKDIHALPERMFVVVVVVVMVVVVVVVVVVGVLLLFWVLLLTRIVFNCCFYIIPFLLLLVLLVLSTTTFTHYHYIHPTTTPTTHFRHVGGAKWTHR